MASLREALTDAVNAYQREVGSNCAAYDTMNVFAAKCARVALEMAREGFVLGREHRPYCPCALCHIDALLSSLARASEGK